jgi:hypothetical protein
MPVQAGTWLGTRLACGTTPRVDGIGVDPEAITGNGPGLAGTVGSQYVVAIGVCCRLDAWCGSSGPCVDRVVDQPGLFELREG